MEGDQPRLSGAAQAGPGTRSAEGFLETLERSDLPPLRGDRHTGEDFRANIVSRDLGPLRLTELVTPAGECFRDARSARAQDSGLWQVEVVTRGHVRAEQGGSTAVLGPTDLVLIDPVRPVRFASSATTHVTMLMPRHLLRLGADDAARLVGARIRGDRGPGALVSSLVRDMTRTLDGFRAHEADRSAAAVIELVAVALASSMGDVRPVDDDVLRTRVVGFIEARLSDRDLGPAKVAAAHHMSVRRLHKLFQDQPLTVAALIRRRRLERCYADLGRRKTTVAAVAASWGFADPAHFSRLFRATYGHSPGARMSNDGALIVNDYPAGPGKDGDGKDVERKGA
ncbi:MULTISPECIES: AraC-like ligand-binding domain-containing protein [Streptomyces]|uniref:AraC-like ligand-binding domain-containing protein n=1 Tax=Streptomyces TaxID=1883 RepID=UPI0023BA0750|nr:MULTISPECIES: helix-turn-helix domain-containing protein [unclassified Streptomyces]MDT0421067.1 helix-turn-helix domain-containing protein [Streptomyces sp. DSM 41859]WEH30916.1 helix-turn-helix domain-containing protein [Streptomyces sp. AM 3-1-1]